MGFLTPSIVIFLKNIKNQLVYKQIFNAEQYNYESNKRNRDPFDPLIIFRVPFFVLSVRKNDNCNKNNCECDGEKALSGTEHEIDLSGRWPVDSGIRFRTATRKDPRRDCTEYR